MPTYDYKCSCGAVKSVFQSIGEYCRAPNIPICHGAMERYLSVAPGFSGIANALAGDRHYDGMRAPDGVDISSRTKHREYMKSRGLAMADDFKGVWSKAAKEREQVRTTGMDSDATRRADVIESFKQLSSTNHG